MVARSAKERAPSQLREAVFTAGKELITGLHQMRRDGEALLAVSLDAHGLSRKIPRCFGGAPTSGGRGRGQEGEGAEMTRPRNTALARTRADGASFGSDGAREPGRRAAFAGGNREGLIDGRVEDDGTIVVVDDAPVPTRRTRPI